MVVVVVVVAVVAAAVVVASIAEWSPVKKSKQCGLQKNGWDEDRRPPKPRNDHRLRFRLSWSFLCVDVVSVEGASYSYTGKGEQTNKQTNKY